MPAAPEDSAARWGLETLHVLDTQAFSAELPLPAHSFSVAFWFQTGHWRGYRVLINHGSPADDAPGWSCALDDSCLRFRLVADAGDSAEASVALEPSPDWRHVAATVDCERGVLRLYVDGALVCATGAPDGCVAGGDSRLVVGGYTDPAGGHFDHTFGRNGTGWIDDVRIYARVLSDAEVTRFVERGDAPNAGFEVDVPAHEAPVSVRFDGRSSSGGLRAWLWDFGDGTRGFGPQVEHRYSYAGDYAVRLMVVDEAHRVATSEMVLRLSGEVNPLMPTLVFVNGAEGYACYRIPSIVRALNGDLVAFAEGRVESCSDSTAMIRAVCKRSADNGRSWSPVQVVARNLIDGGEHAVANISPVVDAATGRIVVLYNKAEVSEWLLARGQGRSRICRVISDDHGLTWGDDTDISAQVQRSADDWRVQRPTLGHAIQLRHPARRGRLLHAGLFTQGDRSVFQSQNYVFWSDDSGDSWQIGGVVPRVGLNEATVVELEDGDLLVNSRAYHDERPEGVRAVTRGHFEADGRLTFGPTRLDAALTDPAVQASLLRYSWADDMQAGSKGRILFSNPAHPHARINLTVRLSEDDGQTWPVARVVDPGPSAYSDMVVQADGRVGLLYERGNQGGIDYVSFTIDWLSGDSGIPNERS